MVRRQALFTYFCVVWSSSPIQLGLTCWLHGIYFLFFAIILIQRVSSLSIRIDTFHRKFCSICCTKRKSTFLKYKIKLILFVLVCVKRLLYFCGLLQNLAGLKPSHILNKINIYLRWISFFFILFPRLLIQ